MYYLSKCNSRKSISSNCSPQKIIQTKWENRVSPNLKCLWNLFYFIKLFILKKFIFIKKLIYIKFKILFFNKKIYLNIFYKKKII